jgi:CDP-paratose 2-epimerase
MIAGAAERAAKLEVQTVLGGMSPFDPNWLHLMFERGALEHVDVIGVHGFPGTWEAVWEGWDVHVERVREVIERHGGGKRIWVTEAGYSTWAHDEFGQLNTLVDLVQAPAERVYWYSLEDLAPEHETLDGFHCDERAYHFGLRRCTGESKLVYRVLRDRGIPGVREMVNFSTNRRSPARGGVLITGGAGFIGTNLGDRLASMGTPVTVLDSLTRPGVEHNLRWLKRKHGNLVRVEVGDVRDVFAVRRAMEGAHRVFHLAAQVAVTTSLDYPRADHEVNLQGTLNVLEEARRVDPTPAIVFTSTNKVYGRLVALDLRRNDDGY